MGIRGAFAETLGPVAVFLLADDDSSVQSVLLGINGALVRAGVVVAVGVDVDVDDEASIVLLSISTECCSKLHL